jgi:ABC-type uncharacterized transport system permease subunit
VIPSGKALRANTSRSKASVYTFLYNILRYRIVTIVVATLFALIFVSITLLLVKANPLQALWLMVRGAFYNLPMVAGVIQVWIPLTLVTCGLMFTFTAGLWNIGMEGQITLGAIFCYGIVLIFMPTNVPSWLVFLLATLAGAVGGMLWAMLVGSLRIYLNVNEIFGGLGLNFIAEAIMLYLVMGPWSPESTASGSTDMLPERFRLPGIFNTGLNPWALLIAILAVVATYFILKGTYFGLKLNAVGKNKKAAFTMGIPTARYMMLAFLFCGIFAGLTGSFQVIGFRYLLRNNISGGYGYLGLLVGMLSNYHPLIGAPIALLFSIVNKGGNSLNTDMHLDSSVAGVFQGALLLFVLMFNGIRKYVMKVVEGG